MLFRLGYDFEKALKSQFPEIPFVGEAVDRVYHPGC